MIQVWCYDNNNIFTESKIVEEVGSCMTTISVGNVGFYKPKWNDIEWIEGATEEEIETWKEENKVVQEPSEGEVLMSNIILENATLKQQTTEQQELTANLLLQIAELKGGNANV